MQMDKDNKYVDREKTMEYQTDRHKKWKVQMKRECINNNKNEESDRHSSDKAVGLQQWKCSVI